MEDLNFAKAHTVETHKQKSGLRAKESNKMISFLPSLHCLHYWEWELIPLLLRKKCNNSKKTVIFHLPMLSLI